jgi:hypothetical protein
MVCGVAISLVSGAALGAAPVALAADAAPPPYEALERQLTELQSQLRQLTQENQLLREQQQRIEAQVAQLSAGTPVRSAAAAPAAVPALAPTEAAALPTPAPPAQPLQHGVAEGVRLWGYGEMYYTAPARDASRTRADLARAVFGLGYSFDERTEFNSEYEVEHAIASASDVGEFEVEQFYVDRRVSDALTVRGGLLLMPFGFLNEHHEPTHFYGVQRNFVETLIIPSTWREGGVNLHADTQAGLGWSLGLTTGFDLSKWNFASQFPPYASALELMTNGVAPLQASHQELSLANGRKLSQFGSVSYYGVPGLALGGALSTGEAVPVRASSATSASGTPRVTLWEAHARWTPRNCDLAALYAHGSISNTAPANAANPLAPNPLPASFYGYFLQGACELWREGEYRLAPFVRWERYNLGASYAGTAGPVIPTGLVPLSGLPGDLGFWPENHDRVWTAGANFSIGPHLVVKGDYQWFKVNRDFRRFDLGLGVSF